MMNEYENQAVEFCNKRGIEIKWLFVGVEINPERKDNKKRNRWMWILEKDGKFTHGEFWDSITNTKETYHDPNKRNNPKNPRTYDLLSCLVKNDYDSFENFCFSFGFNEDSRKAYEEIKKEYNGLVSVFGNNEELWEEFREIY